MGNLDENPWAFGYLLIIYPRMLLIHLSNNKLVDFRSIIVEKP